MENNFTFRVVVHAPTGKMEAIAMFADFDSASHFAKNARKWDGPFPCKYLRVQELVGEKWVCLN